MKIKYRAFLTVLFSALFLFCSSASAYADGSVKLPVKTITEGVAPWVKIECLKDNSPGFVAEAFHPKSKITYKMLKEAFGSDTPHSRFSLLHYAPGFETAGKTPVLLVHGAGDNASRAWCHPYEFEAADGNNIKNPGIMQYLVKQGYPVFAITFSHPHGDNFLQAQQIANAIARIKQVLNGGDDFKVDVICHSKGAMAARIYISSLGEDCQKYSWLTKFRGDVRKIIFVASPLRGIDTAFRYYGYNLTVVSKDMAAPVGVTYLTYLGSAIDFKNYNKMFPGQTQMLFNWVDAGIDLTLQSATPDAGLSAYSLYRGGVTTLLGSNGINAEIKNGGDVINKLNKKGIDPSIKAYVMAGTKQDIDNVTMGIFKIPIGEMAAPSDGVLFLMSATYTDGLTCRGAKVEKIKTFDTHHVGLTVRPDCLEFLNNSLSDEPAVETTCSTK